jgi:hypothetical protein
MTNIKSLKEKPKKIIIQSLNWWLYSYNAFIIEFEKESINNQHWTRFKPSFRYIFDNIGHQDQIRYRDMKMKIVHEIYLDSCYPDNTMIAFNLLWLRITSNDTNQITAFPNQTNFIHEFLLMKDKLKSVRR